MRGSDQKSRGLTAYRELTLADARSSPFGFPLRARSVASRRVAHSLHERCDVLCPDFPKVLEMIAGRPLVGLCRDCLPTPYHAFTHAGYALDSK